LKRIVAECGFVRLADLTGPKLEGWLVGLREAGKSARTFNYYLTAARALFFDFTNRPTYLFFRWVRDGGGHDPEALVSAAMNAAEYEDAFQLDGDAPLAARDALTKLLEPVLGDLQAAAECVGYGDSDGPVDRDQEWMVRALLADSIGQIDLQNVARAMLAEAGKWNPLTEIPEAE
jgi:hypothetical protein